VAIKSIGYELAFPSDHLRPILSASCVGRAALDDVRNWVAARCSSAPPRQLLSSGLATEVRSQPLSVVSLPGHLPRIVGGVVIEPAIVTSPL